MAVNIPATSREQNERGQALTGTDEKTFTRVFKDPSYATLKTAADAIVRGDEYETAYVVNAYDLARTPGGGGKLTLHLKPKDATVGTGNAATTAPKKDIWSLKAVRNDVSIMAYCGDGNDNPNRVHIELWERETDPEVAGRDSFTKPDGTEEALTSADQALVAKKKKGIESVIRFYPMLTRRRVYSSFPPGCLEKLGYVDTPTAPGDAAKKPAGLANKIGNYQWLKVDDSSEEDANGDWTRTEAWMGIKKTDSPDSSPWDADLYGDSRWPMPYAHGGGGSGNEG